MPPTAAEKVWLLSYPRSGNSMLASMALAAIPGCGFDSVYDHDNDVPRFLAEMEKLSIKPPTNPTVQLLKTHHWYEPIPEKIIWLMRDGRDALTSYWHFRDKNTQYKDPVSFWTALSYGDPARGVGVRWDVYVKHIQKLLEGRNHLEVRYEALKTHPEREVQRVAEYVGLKCEPDRLSLVNFNRAHEINPTFYRLGYVGGHKELYQRAKDYLELELGPTLRVMGY